LSKTDLKTCNYIKKKSSRSVSWVNQEYYIFKANSHLAYLQSFLHAILSLSRLLEMPVKKSKTRKLPPISQNPSMILLTISIKIQKTNLFIMK